MRDADLPPDLLARAAAHGLVRLRRCWKRAGEMQPLVWRERSWCWAPESWGIRRGAAARFATEAEALAAACDWLDAGEPEVTP